jgi:hypothetical protein
VGKSGVTAVAVAPGFMRTEAILEGFGVTEATWRDALEHPRAAAMGWAGSETPCFVGRAVAALAADLGVARKNGGIYTSRALAEEYGFTDVDGRRPDHAVLEAAIEQARKTYLAPLVDAARFAAVEWTVMAKAAEARVGRVVGDAKLPKRTRTALAKEGAKAAQRKRRSRS